MCAGRQPSPACGTVIRSPGASALGACPPTVFAILNSPLRFCLRPECLCRGRVCGSGGTGRHTILRGWRREACGFKSRLPHQVFLRFLPIHFLETSSLPDGRNPLRQEAYLKVIATVCASDSRRLSGKIDWASAPLEVRVCAPSKRMAVPTDLATKWRAPRAELSSDKKLPVDPTAAAPRQWLGAPRAVPHRWF